MIAVALIGIIATTAALAATPRAGGGTDPGASPTPDVAVQSSRPTATPPVNPQVVDLLRSLNERFAATGDALQAELRRARFRTPEVANLIREVNQRIGVGVEAVQALDGALGKEQPGGRMAAVYGAMAETATQTLDASINNSAAYQAGAQRLVDLIGRLPELQAALDALAESPPSTAPSSPPPSRVPAPSASPTSGPSPSASPDPSETAEPSPSPSTLPLPPAGKEQIVNGGFEDGVGSPWGLFVGQGAAAALSADTAKPGAGKTSARVDITTGSPAYSGISLRQAGLTLEAGRLYTLTLSSRAASARDVRIRVASTTGASYVNRIAQVGTAWSTIQIVFTAGVGDANAVLELDLGRDQAATLFDAVSFRPVGG
ncbi:MAG TPA: carbohydrate binding domain-containing protein [Candidatus Limnocylindrales bacterium]|nr:carbohydrate binding domain-containing protein [Candidatus Limnocylindrales bacterium]